MLHASQLLTKENSVFFVQKVIIISHTNGIKCTVLTYNNFILFVVHKRQMDGNVIAKEDISNAHMELYIQSREDCKILIYTKTVLPGTM
jgi:hypothetical protein